MIISGIESSVPAKRRSSRNEATVPVPRKIIITPIIRHLLLTMLTMVLVKAIGAIGGPGRANNGHSRIAHGITALFRYLQQPVEVAVGSQLQNDLLAQSAL